MRKTLTVFILIAASVVSSVAAQELISITGAGPSIDITEKFITILRENPWVENNYRFRLDPISTKHAGGIESSDRNLLGRTGRPLTAAEKAKGKEDLFLASIPIAFATADPVGIDAITENQFISIYNRSLSNWSQLGGLDAPIVLIGREETESNFLLLKQAYPFLNSVRFDVVLHNDTAVVNYLKYTTKNGLAFGSAPNLAAFNLIRVNGMNLARTVGLVFDVKNRNHPLILRAIETAASGRWKDKLALWGYQPVVH